MRGVTVIFFADSGMLSFQLTRLMRGVTTCNSVKTSYLRFQLTRLMRGVTRYQRVGKKYLKFQLTRLMRGVTTDDVLLHNAGRISTHTPHARRDNAQQAILPRV